MRLVTLLLLALIRGYQLLISPFFPPACRYLPTCSAYAREAVIQHGPLRGSWLALRRLARCHPLGGWGYDPVPEKKSAETTSAGLGLSPKHRHLEQQAGR